MLSAQPDKGKIIAGVLARGIRRRTTPGGINFDPNLIEMEIRGGGIDFNLPMEPGQPIYVDGLTPVIMQITPALDFPLILGVSEPVRPEEEQPLAAGRAG